MRWVLHVDLDQFIAAVEMLRRPELVGRPVVVGGRGDPTERGVVATASYAAREHGVGSGMPLRTAAKKLPDAVFLPVDREAYDAASAEVMATLRALEWGGVPAVVEVLGWDEAFLAPGEGHGELGDPRVFAQRVRDAVLEATRLGCGVGIGDNKLRAKIAMSFGKTGEGDGSGIGYLTEAEWYDVMGERPTTALWGIGSKIGKRLAGLGIQTVRELAESDARMLADAIGPTMGPWYHRLGRGADSSPVDASPWVPRAHGREETYQSDLTWDVVPGELRVLTARVVEDIDREGRPAARVGIKVRYRPFITVSRSLTLPAPTRDPAVLADAAVSLLDRVEHDRPVRLLGVRLEMVEPEGATEMRDWQAWHDEYDDPASSLSRRLAEVRSQLSSLLDRAAPRSRVSLLSLCAGDGRDTIPVLAASDRRVDACLVELDADLADGARRAAGAAGLDLDVRTGDAGATSAFADRLPVDVLMLCGVFGNVPDDHVVRTVRAAAAMVAPDGAVIWTRGHRVPDDPTLRTGDAASWVRDLFTESGFEELAFVRPEDASYRVGVARLGQGVDRRRAGPLPERLFSFEN